MVTADPLLPERVLPLLRGSFGRPLIHRDSCPSTQDMVRGRQEGTVAVTELQTAGRGRGGRRWECPHSAGILFSLALTPRTPGDRLPTLGLAVADAISETLHPRAQVKWPNDVVVDGRKLAGILLELRGRSLALGVGVNANLAEADLPARTRLPATSLQILRGAPVDRAAVLAELLERIERAYARYEREGFGGVGRDYLAGRRVRFDGGEGGLCAGIQPDGALLVEGRPYRFGEVAAVDGA
jgi:BirA family biotin operon repressor/biotin-[acetyl-CoA-carboxylase] ligase